jgi:hypothetical protein
MATCHYDLLSPSISQFASSTSMIVSYDLSIKMASTPVPDACKRFSFYFSKGNSTNYTRVAKNSFNESINYNLYKFSSLNSILKDKNDVNEDNDFLFGEIQDTNNNIVNTFYFNLPSLANGSLVRAGVYTDNIAMNVYSKGANGTKIFEFSRNIPITINVSKVINISLIDSGGPFDIGSTNKTLNFGDLETGKEMSFDLRVASNAGYKVMFSSMNNGAMKNTINPQKINYGLTIAGNTVNLLNTATNPVTVATGSGVTISEGAQFPIKVKIGTVATTQEYGDYEDYITITAATND